MSEVKMRRQQVTTASVRVESSLDAVRRVREFLASQGFYGDIASKLMFTVRTARVTKDNKNYYEIYARIPEPDNAGKLRITTYRFLVDIETGDVIQEGPVEDANTAS